MPCPSTVLAAYSYALGCERRELQYSSVVRLHRLWQRHTAAGVKSVRYVSPGTSLSDTSGAPRCVTSGVGLLGTVPFFLPRGRDGEDLSPNRTSRRCPAAARDDSRSAVTGAHAACDRRDGVSGRSCCNNLRFLVHLFSDVAAGETPSTAVVCLGPTQPLQMGVRFDARVHARSVGRAGRQPVPPVRVLRPLLPSSAIILSSAMG